MTTGEETALHYAASKGHVQVIKYLHEQCNGDLNATYSKVINVLFIKFRSKHSSNTVFTTKLNE